MRPFPEQRSREDVDRAPRRGGRQNRYSITAVLHSMQGITSFHGPPAPHPCTACLHPDLHPSCPALCAMQARSCKQMHKSFIIACRLRKHPDQALGVEKQPLLCTSYPITVPVALRHLRTDAVVSAPDAHRIVAAP